MDASTEAAPERPARRTTAARPRRSRPSSERIAVGIDFGGSGIKGALVDLANGTLLTERHRLKTPRPATPKACIAVMAQLLEELNQERSFGRETAVGVGMAAAVVDGITATAVNIDESWLGYLAEEGISEGLGRAVTVLNDADAAGLGEMRYGAGLGHMGSVVLITLGTGIGSALFRDGRLVPNTELGHIEVRGRDAEERASAAARERRKQTWSEYAGDLDEYLHKLDMLVWPDLMIIGGGISKDADRFLDKLTVRPQVIPAALRNNAGIVGAALAASERSPRPVTGAVVAEQG